MKGGLHYDNQKLAISSAIQVINLNKKRTIDILNIFQHGFVNTYGAIDGVYRFPNICNVRCSLK
jgi:hypothetical protein